MNTIQNKSIAVVGAGPGGLTLARLLQLKRANVKVYERDPDKHARLQGATLDLHEESGLRAIREAGLMKAFEQNYRPDADKIRVMNKSASIVFDDHETAAGYTDRPEIDRGPLRNLLLDSLLPDTVQWNHRFVSLSEAGNGRNLHFDNAPDVKADLVVAADGASSKIRPYITPIRPFYAGITAVEGSVYHSEVNAPRVHQLLKGGKIFAMDEEKSIIVSAKGDGSLTFYTGEKVAENQYRESGIDFSDRAQVLAWFERNFGRWHEVWRELIEGASLPLWPRPQYCMPLDQHWESLADITMLGDAAHLMPPYAGEGVNMAMLDAVELAGCLTSEIFAETRAAIEKYERGMRTRAAETAAMTMANTVGLHGPDGTGFFMNVIGEA